MNQRSVGKLGDDLQFTTEGSDEATQRAQIYVCLAFDPGNGRRLNAEFLGHIDLRAMAGLPHRSQ